jgi:CheY-like chemotaxis protein
MYRSVLLVGVDAQAQLLWGWLCEGWGYEVVISGSGAEALGELDRRVPGLILLDSGPGDMPLSAFAAELERRAPRPAVPLLVLGSGPRAEREARRTGAEGYLAKPVRPPELFWKLERMWEKARALQERLLQQQDQMAAQAIRLQAIREKAMRQRAELARQRRVAPMSRRIDA